jgi:hypothetical protein
LIRKRREQCVLLLDDCFDSKSSHAKIAACGFTAERFTSHFPDRNNPDQRQKKIKDPTVIALCQKYNFLLFTTDREMKKTHIEELKRSDIGVVATANNTDGVDTWVKALFDARAKVLRDFKKWQRPYFSILQKTGHVTTETLTLDRTSRRTRPKEKEPAAS